MRIFLECVPPFITAQQKGHSVRRGRFSAGFGMRRGDVVPMTITGRRAALPAATDRQVCGDCGGDRTDEGWRDHVDCVMLDLSPFGGGPQVHMDISRVLS